MQLPVLLHPPKTGGISLRTAVARHVDPAPQWATQRGHQLPKYYGASPGDPAAILVRNPYTRFVAMYNHAVNDKKQINPSMFAVKMFNEALSADDNNFYNSVNCYPCYFWQRECTGPVEVIRFENYVEDVQRVYKLNMHQEPHMNQRSGQRKYVCDVAEFYNEKILATVNFLWREDFEHYGYIKFDRLSQMLTYCKQQGTT